MILQVCLPPQTGTGSRVFFSVKPRIVPSGQNKGMFGDCLFFLLLFFLTGSDRLLVDWLPPFGRCGFVDWRFVSLDDSGLVAPLPNPHLCSGRVIVQPKIRVEVMHELSTSSMSFTGMAARLKDMQRSGITTL